MLEGERCSIVLYQALRKCSLLVIKKSGHKGKMRRVYFLLNEDIAHQLSAVIVFKWQELALLD